MLVIAPDAALAARIEWALPRRSPHPVIVSAGSGGLAALRAAHPHSALVAVAVPRGQIAAALDAGADAAMSGTLRPAELRARLRAIARRADGRWPARRWSVGPLTLDRAAGTVELDGELLALPARELELLFRLAAAPGRVVTKDELRPCRGGSEQAAPSSRTLERSVARLRHRLGRHGGLIVTVWGIGYRLGAAV